VADPFPGWDPVGERGGAQADAGPQLPDGGPPEPLPEDVHRARGRVEQAGGDAEQRGLAGAVGAAPDPPLVQLDPPGHCAPQLVAGTGHPDPLHLDHAVRVRIAPHRPILPRPSAVPDPDPASSRLPQDALTCGVLYQRAVGATLPAGTASAQPDGRRRHGRGRQVTAACRRRQSVLNDIGGLLASYLVYSIVRMMTPPRLSVDSSRPMMTI